MTKGWTWAVAAGSTAAGAAVSAKLASPLISLNLRLLYYGAAIGLNVIMWSCFMRSLQKLSSLQATVLNFGANFLLTGLAGFFLFGETLHAQWFVGASLIVLGILVLSKASSETTEKQD